MQYVVMKDEDTEEVYFVARFIGNGLSEIWNEGVWEDKSHILISMLHDGLLENITEIEAQNYIAQLALKELQTV